MGAHRLAEAATVLGVSDDTLRRWQNQGRFEAVHADGRAGISGTDLARLAVEEAHSPGDAPSAASMRNRLRGVVTAITRDTVMAQVELSCGPYRVVSLISSEAVDDLGLEVGSLAWASVKSTNVSLEVTP
ncbi:molybdopterin-binding protein [Aeromicrobium sp. CTD01-1L150]|uniref:TOBE domain-containing protein n=1 Tax=Aeromicrobium sp. CTD01-1L150 TaxID=3341830 RepID=UPI0035C22EE2